MSDFISVLDMKENNLFNEQRDVRNEILNMDYDIKRTMDAGLSPDEMTVATQVRDAVQAADTLLQKFFA